MRTQKQLKKQVLKDQQLIVRLQEAELQHQAAKQERLDAIVAAHTGGWTMREIARAIDLSHGRIDQLLKTDEAKQIAQLQVLNKIDNSIKEQSPQFDKVTYLRSWCIKALKKLNRGEPILLNLRPHSERLCRKNRRVVR